MLRQGGLLVCPVL